MEDSFERAQGQSKKTISDEFLMSISENPNKYSVVTYRWCHKLMVILHPRQAYNGTLDFINSYPFNTESYTSKLGLGPIDNLLISVFKNAKKFLSIDFADLHIYFMKIFTHLYSKLLANT